MTETETGQGKADITNFSGTWNLVKNDNLEGFLAANGANWMIRKLAATSSPRLDVTQTEKKFSFKLVSLMMTKETNFTVDEVYEEKQHSGDVMVCTPSWDGQKLIINMKPKDEASTIKPQRHLRHVEGDQLIVTLEVGDVTAKRYFKRA